MNQICNYVDYCNAYCACSKILMHLMLTYWWFLLWMWAYVFLKCHQRRQPSDFSLHETKSDFMVTSVTDRYQLPSLFSTRFEKCVLSPYFGVSLVFPFVSWTRLETMATQSPVTEDLLPPSMAWACPVSCAVGVCLVLPLRFLLHLMMRTDVLSKHPKR